MIARRIVVRGWVQGVSFRDWTQATAKELGVAGWVRNRPDGSVEVHAEGAEEKVNALIQALHAGPRAARVDHVDVADIPPEGAATFERHRTG